MVTSKMKHTQNTSDQSHANTNRPISDGSIQPNKVSNVIAMEMRETNKSEHLLPQ